MGGSELGWRCIVGRDQEEMGGKDSGSELSAAGSRGLAGGRRKEVSVQPPMSVRKQGPPLGPAPWSL